MATSLHYLSTRYVFFFKNSQLIEYNCNLYLIYFYMIQNLRTLSNPENWLADKNQLFPYLDPLGQPFNYFVSFSGAAIQSLAVYE